MVINNTSHGSVSYAYNAAGNLTTKSDYGSHYQYGNVSKTAGGNAGPNALRQLTRGSDIVNLTYDNAGNLTGGDGMTLTYDGNNHTTSVTRDGAHLTFEYDAAGQRFRQVKTKDGQTTVTHYIGNVEKVLESGSKTSEVYRIDIGGHTTINKVISGTVNAPQTSYVLRDRLGSVSVVVSGDGTSPVVWERRDYDAFGKPIDLPGHTLPPEFTVTQRGFTDHEHLGDVELIHMNGRAYDYNTGRFLSVDPFIQSPSDSQSVNPYSYIMNNPLSGTDPTGYTSEQDIDASGDEPEPIQVSYQGACSGRAKKTCSVTTVTITKNKDGSVTSTTTTTVAKASGVGKVAFASKMVAAENGTPSVNQEERAASSTAGTMSTGGTNPGAVLNATKKSPKTSLPGVALAVLGHAAIEGGKVLSEVVEDMGITQVPYLGAGTMSSPPGGPDEEEDVNDYSNQLSVSRNEAQKNIRLATNAQKGDVTHHLIPWQFRDHAMIKLAARSGFNMNGARNGMNFRAGENLHMWGRRHSRYNKIIGRLLDRDMKRNPNMSPQEAARRVHHYADRARHLLNQSTRKLGR